MSTKRTINRAARARWSWVPAVLAVIAALSLPGVGVAAAATKAPATAQNVSVSVNPAVAQVDVPAAYTFTFKAATAFTNGGVTLTVPAGWTPPQVSAATNPGFVVASKGTCSGVLVNPPILGSGPWTIDEASGVNCLAGQYFTITYLNAFSASVPAGGSSSFGPVTARPSGSTSQTITPAPVIAVSPGPTTQFAVTGAASTAAGSNYSFTVTAEDASGDPTPAYAGSIVFSSSDTAASTKLPKSPATLKSGTGSFIAVLTTLSSAQAPSTITATDSTTPTIKGHLSVVVTPGAPSHLAFTPNPPGPGVVNTAIPKVSVSVLDTFGNTVSSVGSGTVTIAIVKGSPQAAFTSGTTNEQVIAGVARFTNLVVGTPGTYVLTATPSGITGLKTAVTSSSFNVAGHVSVSPLTLPAATVGRPFTQALTPTGGVAPYTFSFAGSAPSWLSLSPSGTLSGTPTTYPSGGTVGFTVSVHDSATPANTASVPYTLTVDKGASPFTITAGGSTSATITYGSTTTLAESGLPAGAAGTVTFSTATTPSLCSFNYPSQTSCSTKATLAAGTYSGLSGTFTDTDGNYNGSTSTNQASLVVKPAPVTVTASSGTVTYGAAAPIVTPSYSGLQNGQLAPLSAPMCTTTISTSDQHGGNPVVAGSPYTSSCSGAADDNYIFSYVSGTLTVNPAPLKVTASSGQITYGAGTPAVVPTYQNLENGDSGPATPPTCTTVIPNPSVDQKTGGNLTVADSPYSTSCSGAADPDYTITYASGTLTVNPAQLTVTPTPSSNQITYGTATPQVGPDYQGLQNGDAAPATPASCTTVIPNPTLDQRNGNLTVADSPYSTTCSGAVDPDYTISYGSDGSLMVAPLALKIIASDATDTNGTISPVTPIYQTLVNGDTQTQTPPVCTGDVGTQSTNCTGASDPNYSPINYQAGTLAIHNPACFSGTDTYESTALANKPTAYWTLGDTSGTTAADATGGTNAGTYSSAVGLGAAPIVPGDTSCAATFSPGGSGTDSYVTLPANILNASTTTSTSQSVELWFQTGQTHEDWVAAGSVGTDPDGGGGLLSMASGEPGSGGNATPTLYVGSDGYLYGEESFIDGQVAVLKSSVKVDDGKPHYVALTADGTNGVETLYLDGSFQMSTPDLQLGSTTVTFDPTAYGMSDDFIGTASFQGNWPADTFPQASGWRSFNGTIDEAAVYPGVLSATQVGADCQSGFGSACADAPAASQLAFSVQPGGAAAGANLSPQPQVTIEDSFGQPVIDDTSTISLSLNDIDGLGAHLTCSPSTNDQTPTLGVATFANCSIDKASDFPNTYSLTATDSADGLNVTSDALTISSAGPAAAPFSITVDGTSSDSVTYGSSAVLAETGLPAAATGTVTFSTATVPDLCSFDYPAATSCSTSASLDAGTYSGIQANFADTDGAYASSTSTNTVDLTVDQATQTITFTSPAPPNPTVGDQYPVTAQSNVPGLDVTFIVPSTPSACHVVNPGPNAATVMFDTAETCVIEADQPGNTDYAPATATQTVFFNHSTVALPFEAGGWSYLPIDGTDPASGYQSRTFDDSSWSVGPAGFGNVDGGCAWNTTPIVGTPTPNWEAANPSDLFLRHHFSLPAGATNIHIEGTVDNDATVWLNGTEVTTPPPNSTYPETLDVNSGGCASDGINVMADSAAILGADNVIAVRARNEGGPAFIDLTVTYTPASASQTISFHPPASGVVGTSIPLSATGGPSGNPVVFSVDGSSASECAMDNTTPNQLDLLAVGSCVIHADQAGNGTYGSAPQVTATIDVTTPPIPPFNISVDGSSSDSVTYGSSAVLAETGLPAAATGTVTFSTATVADLCSFDYPAATSCSTSTSLDAGPYSAIQGSFTDTDGAYANSTSTNTVDLTVNQVAQTITFNPPTTAVAGTNTALSANGGPSGNPVTFAVDNSSSSVCAIDAVTANQLDFLAAGPCVVHADQAGSTDYMSAPEVTATITVDPGPAASQLAFTVQPGGAAPGAALSTQPQVTIEDSSGNPVTADNSTISLSLVAPAGAAAQLTCNPSSNDQSPTLGVATFADCAVDQTGTYQLKATDATDGLSITSNPFSIAAAATCASPTITWTGGGDGANWSDPNNWDAARIPGTSDAVCIPSTASAVTFDVPSASVASVTALSTAGLTVAGSNTLTVTGGSSQITNLTLDGVIDLPSGNTLHLDGAATLGGGSVTGPGTVELDQSATAALGSATTGDATEFDSGATLQIDAGATATWVGGESYYRVGPGTILCLNGGSSLGLYGTLVLPTSVDGGNIGACGGNGPEGTLTVETGGQLERQGTAGQTVNVYMAVDNLGTVQTDANGGGLTFQAGNSSNAISDSGHWNAQGDPIAFAYGSRAESSSAVFGAGPIDVTGGTVMFTNDTVPNLEIDGSGTVSGHVATYDFTGAGGSFDGASSQLSVANPPVSGAHGSASLGSATTGDATEFDHGATLQIDSGATATWTGGESYYRVGPGTILCFNGGSSLVLAGTLVLPAAVNGGNIGACGENGPEGTLTVEAGGQLERQGTTGQTVNIYMAVDNLGTVQTDANGGSLSFQAGNSSSSVSDSGHWNAQGDRIVFAYGSRTESSGAAFGAGPIDVTGGTMAFTYNTVPSLEIEGSGTVSGNVATYDFTGVGGSYQGPNTTLLVIPPPGQGTHGSASLGSSTTGDATEFDNGGGLEIDAGVTATWNAGESYYRVGPSTDLCFNGGSSLFLVGTLVLPAAVDGGNIGACGANGPEGTLTVRPGGVIERQGSAGQTVNIYMPVDNLGTVQTDASGGRLTFQAGNSSSTVSDTGHWNAQGDPIIFAGGARTESSTAKFDAGDIYVTGGNLAFDGNAVPGLGIQGGQVTGDVQATSFGGWGGTYGPGTLTFLGPAELNGMQYVSGAHVIVASTGTATWDGNSLCLSDGSTLEVQGQGHFEITGGADGGHVQECDPGSTSTGGVTIDDGGHVYRTGVGAVYFDLPLSIDGGEMTLASGNVVSDGGFVENGGPVHSPALYFSVSGDSTSGWTAPQLQLQGPQATLDGYIEMLEPSGAPAACTSFTVVDANPNGYTLSSPLGYNDQVGAPGYTITANSPTVTTTKTGTGC